MDESTATVGNRIAYEYRDKRMPFKCDRLSHENDILRLGH